MRLHYLAALVLVGALIGLYRPGTAAGFVYEDRDWTDHCRQWTPAVSLSSIPRWLTRASWCVWPTQSARVAHLLSLGLHLSVGLLVWCLLWTLTDHDPWPTWLGTAVVLLSPVAIESVAYASSRGELIAAIGILAACLAALGRRWRYVPLAALVAVLGKESGVVVLALVPVVLWAARRVLIQAVGVGVALVAGLALGVAWMGNLWGGAPAPWIWARLMVLAIARVLGVAVGLVTPTVDADYTAVPGLAVLVALAVGAWLIVRAVRYQRDLGWGWREQSRLMLRAAGVLWIACALVPRFLVPTPLSVLPEHQFYTANVGLGLLVAGWVA